MTTQESNSTIFFGITIKWETQGVDPSTFLIISGNGLILKGTCDLFGATAVLLILFIDLLSYL